MSTTRKMFRFFKHFNSIKSMKNNYSDLKQNIIKFKKKFLHDIQGKKNHFEKSSDLKKIKKKNVNYSSENSSLIYEESCNDQNYDDKSENMLENKLNEKIKINEEPFYRDSKKQLISRIVYSLCKLSSNIFGFCYLIADHLSFFTKIEVITHPLTKQVNLYNF